MKGLLVDPIPSPSNSHHNNCEADHKKAKITEIRFVRQ